MRRYINNKIKKNLMKWVFLLLAIILIVGCQNSKSYENLGLPDKNMEENSNNTLEVESNNTNDQNLEEEEESVKFILPESYSNCPEEYHGDLVVIEGKNLISLISGDIVERDVIYLRNILENSILVKENGNSKVLIFNDTELGSFTDINEESFELINGSLNYLAKKGMWWYHFVNKDKLSDGFEKVTKKPVINGKYQFSAVDTLGSNFLVYDHQIRGNIFDEVGSLVVKDDVLYVSGKNKNSKWDLVQLSRIQEEFDEIIEYSFIEGKLAFIAQKKNEWIISYGDKAIRTIDFEEVKNLQIHSGKMVFEVFKDYKWFVYRENENLGGNCNNIIFLYESEGKTNFICKISKYYLLYQDGTEEELYYTEINKPKIFDEKLAFIGKREGDYQIVYDFDDVTEEYSYIDDYAFFKDTVFFFAGKRKGGNLSFYNNDVIRVENIGISVDDMWVEEEVLFYNYKMSSLQTGYSDMDTTIYCKLKEVSSAQSCSYYTYQMYNLNHDIYSRDLSLFYEREQLLRWNKDVGYNAKKTTKKNGYFLPYVYDFELGENGVVVDYLLSNISSELGQIYVVADRISYDSFNSLYLARNRVPIEETITSQYVVFNDELFGKEENFKKIKKVGVHNGKIYLVGIGDKNMIIYDGKKFAQEYSQIDEVYPITNGFIVIGVKKGVQVIEWIEFKKISEYKMLSDLYVVDNEVIYFASPIMETSYYKNFEPYVQKIDTVDSVKYISEINEVISIISRDNSQYLMVGTKDPISISEGNYRLKATLFENNMVLILEDNSINRTVIYDFEATKELSGNCFFGKDESTYIIGNKGIKEMK
jgi:hypothetical protein